jgi:hypothetical protein
MPGTPVKLVTAFEIRPRTEQGDRRPWEHQRERKLGSALLSPVLHFHPAVDQRGLLRPVDGNADGIKRYDVGAFERQP